MCLGAVAASCWVRALFRGVAIPLALEALGDLVAVAVEFCLEWKARVQVDALLPDQLCRLGIGGFDDDRAGGLVVGSVELFFLLPSDPGNLGFPWRKGCGVDF